MNIRIIRVVILIFAINISANTVAKAQENEVSTKLSYLADIMRNTIMPDHRTKAANDFHELFVHELTATASIDENYSYLATFISIISPSDSSFRIFSWQVDLKDNHRYYGILQTKNGEIIELKDHSSELIRSTYELLNVDNWYGALYYNIYSFKSDGKKHHLLFGYNAKNKSVNQKIIEVLSFDKQGNIVFGAPVFRMDDARRPDEKYRYIIEYEENAIARLNFDEELNKIVFDHLIPYGSYVDENTEIMVPDGSYSSFEFKKGKWIYNEKLFHHISEKPPGTGKVKSNKKRDLFGREK